MIFVAWYGLAIVCFTLGVLAYTGRWTKWAEQTGYSNTKWLGALVSSVGMAMAPLVAVFPSHAVDSGFVRLWLYVAVAICLVGTIGILFGWLPSFLLPKWFKEGREQRREVDRAEKELRKTAKSLKKARRRNE